MEREKRPGFRDTILIVKIHKDGSVLESRIEKRNSITNNIWSGISKSNSASIMK